MTLLIMCVHLFKEYVTMELPLGLFQLAEIMDLTSSKEFDIKSFYGLVDKFEASDALSFVQFLLIYFCGTNPLEREGHSNIEFWKYYDDIEELFVPDPKMDNHIRNIGPNAVQATRKNNPAIWYNHKSTESSDSTNSINFYSWPVSEGCSFPYSFSFYCESDVLVLNLEVPFCLEENRFMRRIMFKFGHDEVSSSIAIVFGNGELLRGLNTNNGNVKMLSSKDSKYLFEISIPFKILNLDASSDLVAILQSYMFTSDAEYIHEIIPLNISLDK